MAFKSSQWPGDVRPRDAEFRLNVEVTKPCRQRALEALGAVIAIFDDHGVKVWTDARRTWATIFGQEVNFKVTERYRNVRMPPPEPSERSDPFRRKRQQLPTGELTFHIVNDSDYTMEKWSVGVEAKVEAIVPTIVAGMIKTAVRYRRAAEDKRRAEEFRRLRVEELQRLKGEIEAEEKCTAQLEERASFWRKATLIREYALAVLEYHKQQGSDVGPDGSVGRWITWALQHADRLDPLKESPASILDRKGELRELKELAPDGW